jgi:hypothetical protein
MRFYQSLRGLRGKEFGVGLVLANRSYKLRDIANHTLEEELPKC